MKITAENRTINAKIISIEKQEFLHPANQLARIKMQINCEIKRDYYDFLKYLYRIDTSYLISFEEDLIPLGVPEFIPPFEALTDFITGQYDGIKYNCTLHLHQIL